MEESRQSCFVVATSTSPAPEDRPAQRGKRNPALSSCISAEILPCAAPQPALCGAVIGGVDMLVLPKPESGTLAPDARRWLLVRLPAGNSRLGFELL